MDKKQKAICFFIKERLGNRDKWVLRGFLVSFVIIICEHIDRISFFDFVGTVVPYLKEGTVLYTLAVSYLSGVIVYFLTIVLPETRKRKSILVEMGYILQELEDEFTSLRLEFSIEDWCLSDEAIESAVQIVKQHTKSNNKFYNLNFCVKTLETLAQGFNNLTSVMLSYSPVLNEEELDNVIKIRRSGNAYLIKYKYGIENLMKESDVRNYFKKLAQLNKDVIQFHKIIKERIYKQ